MNFIKGVLMYSPATTRLYHHQCGRAGVTCVGVRGEHVHEAVVGVEDAEAGDEEGLLQDVAPPEPGHPLVPDTAQHLITLRSYTALDGV